MKIPQENEKPRLLPVLTTLAVSVLALPGSGRRSGIPTELDELDLTELSLEELLDMEVTIASRTEQKLSDVPGAVYVLTGDEIRRSGHSSIQEALRMVPGFYVSNWTTTEWDVTSRGFGNGTALANQAFLNQLLVLIDGVVVYTPLFAGVWWALQDIDLEDVDRIEVIRGPGGILWGSNAVHGVVHVITKDAGDTQGVKVGGRTANDEWNAGGRYGGSFGENANYRLYYKSSRYDTHANPFLGFSQDWGIDSVGMRVDLGAQDERRTTLWGRAYQAELDGIGFELVGFTVIPVTDDKQGYQVFGSSTSADGSSTVTAWVSNDRQDIETELDLDITTLDVEYKHQFDWSDTSRLVAGLGYRRVRSDVEGDDDLFQFFIPEERTQHNFRLFAVQTWNVPAWDVDFVLGAQLEKNEFTDYEVQPTARVMWRPAEDWATWAAVTHSRRTPSLEEVDLSTNSFFVGDPDFESEEATTFEVGVRRQIGELALLDVAAFYNDYNDLHFEEPLGGGNFQLTNGAEGEAYGVEVAADAKPSDRWSIRSAWTFIGGNIQEKATGADEPTDDYHPRHQLNVRSYFDLAEDWELDTAAYFYEHFGGTFESAERWRLDVRLGWQPRDDLRVYVGAQQLNSATDSQFDEFDKVRRQFFVGLTWTPRFGQEED
jgi:iron complex outermembrane receptor protein